MGIFKNIAGNLLDWLGVANVPAALTALAGLKGSTGQIIEIGGVDAQGGVTELVAVDKPGGGSDSGQNSNSGLSPAAARLLITILRDCPTYHPQTANIDALEALLAAGATPDAPPSAGVTQTGSVLTITSGVTTTQDGDTLTIT